MKIRFNWGVGIAVVYTAFAAGTLSVVILSATTDVDLVSEDYYQRSLSFDQQIDADGRGRAAGAGIAVDDTGLSPRLVLTMPVTGPAVTSGTITLYRPSASGSDRTYPLALDGAGRQSVDLTGIPAGHWQTQLRWVAGGRDYYVQQDIVTP